MLYHLLLLAAGFSLSVEQDDGSHCSCTKPVLVYELRRQKVNRNTTAHILVEVAEQFPAAPVCLVRKASMKISVIVKSFH